jgi:hypothetical protein
MLNLIVSTYLSHWRSCVRSWGWGDFSGVGRGGGGLILLLVTGERCSIAENVGRGRGGSFLPVTCGRLTHATGVGVGAGLSRG